MKCTDVQSSLGSYSTGALSSADARTVRDHLLSCVECQREWKAMALTLRALEAVEQVSPPHDLWPGIRERLTARPARPPQVTWTSRVLGLLRPRPRRVFAFAAVSLVAAFTFAVVHLGQFPRPEPTPLPSHSSTFVRAHMMSAGDHPLADPVAMGMLAMATDSAAHRREMR